jgi:hypothetical protein
MEKHERRLEKAQRRLAEQQILVGAQKALIARLKRAGEATEVPEDMLLRMEKALAIFRADLDLHYRRHRRRLKAPSSQRWSSVAAYLQALLRNLRLGR